MDEEKFHQLVFCVHILCFSSFIDMKISAVTRSPGGTSSWTSKSLEWFFLYYYFFFADNHIFHEGTSEMDQAKVCVTFVLITGVIKQLLTVSESFLVCSSLCLHVIVILKAYYSLPFFFFFCHLHHSLPHPTQSLFFSWYYLFFHFSHPHCT